MYLQSGKCDRLKPAYMIADDITKEDNSEETQNSTPSTSLNKEHVPEEIPAGIKDRKICSGIRVHFPDHLQVGFF